MKTDAVDVTLRGVAPMGFVMASYDRSWALLLFSTLVAGCHSPTIDQSAPLASSHQPASALPTTLRSLTDALTAAPSAPLAAKSDPHEKPTSEAPPVERYRPFTSFVADSSVGGLARAQAAESAKGDVVRELFADADVAWPPAELLIRGFKQEAELEVWASGAQGEPMGRIATYTICAASGELGPKRAEGDYQVPEGFYRIAYLWPQSSYHLAMKVSYPNAADKILGHPTHPGSDIMIHGACASVGCLAMSDERIQEIYVMGAALQSGHIDVELYPTRDLDALKRNDLWKKHGAFWENIYIGFDHFEATKRPARPTIAFDGAYVFK